MLRRWSVLGLLLLCVLQVGCGCRGGMRWNCLGCGEKYWGAYVNDPPRGEPCDCYGNWIGCGGASCGEPACGEPSCGVGSCCGSGDGCGSKYPWVRSRYRRASFWQMLACRNDWHNAGCCEPSCGVEPGCCAEPACGVPCEPACGEPGCGCGSAAAECGCGETHVLMSRSPQRRVVPMQTASHATTVDYRMPPSKGCNCGKH